MAATAAVPALGPFISGALVDWLSWRWLFVVPLVLPLGALAITRAISETRDYAVYGAAAVLIVLVNRRRMFTREGAVTEILMPGEEAGSGAEHTEPAGALTAAR